MRQDGGMRQVLKPVTWLDAMARQGTGPEDVAAEAELIVAGWWWNGCGDPDRGRLVRVIGERRRWCAVAAAKYAVSWARFSRAGMPRDAERARDSAVAFDHTWTALGPIAAGRTA